MKDSFSTLKTLRIGDREVRIASLEALDGQDRSIGRLPYATRILLENLLRRENGVDVTASDIEAIIGWQPEAEPSVEIAFMPARVLLQDFTGVPAVVDLAAMRDAMVAMGGDAGKINPLQPVELVIDHSVQVDEYGTDAAVGTRDEFGGFMWGPEAPLATGAVSKLRTLFASSDPVEPGRLYGNTQDGSARMLLTPPVIHAWLHQSSAGITPAINWFARTLKGANSLPADDQIWPWREVGDLVALLAIPALIAGAMTALAGYRHSAVANDATTKAATRRSGLELAAIAVIPALLFIPACMLTEATLGQNGLFRQTFTNQFAGWALLSAGLSVLALKSRGMGLPMAAIPRSLVIALLALLPAYMLVLATDRLLHVNPSWWFITIRPVTIERTRDFLLYAPFFTVNCLASLCLIQSISPLQNGTMAGAVVRAVAATSGGFLAFLVVQYGVLALTGHLLLPGEGLRVISAIGFAVCLAFVGIFGVVSRRMLGSIAPGAMISGLFVTWVLVATQPIGA